MNLENYKPIEGLKEALNQPVTPEVQKAAEDEYQAAVDKELARQEAQETTRRMGSRKRRLLAIQARPGQLTGNTMEKPGFTREQQ